jgi:hypothetical protein
VALPSNKPQERGVWVELKCSEALYELIVKSIYANGADFDDMKAAFEASRIEDGGKPSKSDFEEHNTLRIAE